MGNARLDEAQAWIKIAGRNINNLRHTDDPNLMAEREELKSLLMKVKEESEKVGLNNSKQSNWQRINLKNIEAPPAAQLQKNKWHNQKMGQRTKQTFLQRKHTHG